MSEQTQITEEGMREALREVVDPEIGMNIIELGLIRAGAPQRVTLTIGERPDESRAENPAS